MMYRTEMGGVVEEVRCASPLHAAVQRAAFGLEHGERGVVRVSGDIATPPTTFVAGHDRDGRAWARAITFDRVPTAAEADALRAQGGFWLVSMHGANGSCESVVVKFWTGSQAVEWAEVARRNCTDGASFLVQPHDRWAQPCPWPAKKGGV